MLEIKIPGNEFFDEETSEFIVQKPVTLHFEHSLRSLSKWESFYKKPFLTEDKKTPEESYYYYQCMCLDSVDDPEVFKLMPDDCKEKINDYLKDPYTATTVKEPPHRPGSHMIWTAEVFYYQLIARGIPLDFENRNLNWVAMYLKVHDQMEAHASGKGRKMPKSEAMARQRRINQERLSRK